MSVFYGSSRILVSLLLLQQCFAFALKGTGSSSFSTSSDVPSSSNDLRHPVVIAGAGPASLVFAQRHLRNDPNAVIHIYERSSRPPRYCELIPSKERDVTPGDFAFGFGFVTRGWLALGKVPGLEECIKKISILSMTGTYMTNRRDMCAEMIHKLETDFPNNNRIQFHFKCQVEKLYSNQTISIIKNCGDDKNGNSNNDINEGVAVVVPYSLLVAADGTNSKIRKSLIDMKKARCKRYYNSLSWKALQLPAQPNTMKTGGFLAHQEQDDTRNELCFVTPRYKDRFVMMYYRFNRKDPLQLTNPMDVSNVEDFKTTMTTMFGPNITEFPPDEVLKTFIDKNPGQEVYMKLNRHAIPELNVALVGDAAVGTYVLFGHGCVSSMERANMLAECLADNPQNQEEALRQFSTESVKEGYAISDLNLISHILRKPLLRKRGMKIRSQIQKLLAEEPDVPYSGILKQVKWTIGLSKIFWRFDRKRVPL